ncbi:unnamed protein product [Anisakis simplex]|uniref:Zf-C3H1 domain-containing protein n=1 Tax=Anisakis simplex TaxID=6269 RepID=A0A0M3K7H5_ANISI|nr:unnamed protein product [Anisakis simplex]
MALHGDSSSPEDGEIVDTEGEGDEPYSPSAYHDNGMIATVSTTASDLNVVSSINQDDEKEVDRIIAEMQNFSKSGPSEEAEIWDTNEKVDEEELLRRALIVSVQKNKRLKELQKTTPNDINEENHGDLHNKKDKSNCKYSTTDAIHSNATTQQQHDNRHSKPSCNTNEQSTTDHQISQSEQPSSSIWVRLDTRHPNKTMRSSRGSSKDAMEPLLITVPNNPSNETNVILEKESAIDESKSHQTMWSAEYDEALHNIRMNFEKQQQQQSATAAAATSSQSPAPNVNQIQQPANFTDNYDQVGMDIEDSDRDSQSHLTAPNEPHVISPAKKMSVDEPTVDDEVDKLRAVLLAQVKMRKTVDEKAEMLPMNLEEGEISENSTPTFANDHEKRCKQWIEKHPVPREQLLRLGARMMRHRRSVSSDRDTVVLSDSSEDNSPKRRSGKRKVRRSGRDSGDRMTDLLDQSNERMVEDLEKSITEHQKQMQTLEGKIRQRESRRNSTISKRDRYLNHAYRCCQEIGFLESELLMFRGDLETVKAKMTFLEREFDKMKKKSESRRALKSQESIAVKSATRKGSKYRVIANREDDLLQRDDDLDRNDRALSANHPNDASNSCGMDSMSRPESTHQQTKTMRSSTIDRVMNTDQGMAAMSNAKPRSRSHVDNENDEATIVEHSEMDGNDLVSALNKQHFGNGNFFLEDDDSGEEESGDLIEHIEERDDIDESDVQQQQQQRKAHEQTQQLRRSGSSRTKIGSGKNKERELIGEEQEQRNDSEAVAAAAAAAATPAADGSEQSDHEHDIEGSTIDENNHSFRSFLDEDAGSWCLVDCVDQEECSSEAATASAADVHSPSNLAMNLNSVKHKRRQLLPTEEEETSGLSSTEDMLTGQAAPMTTARSTADSNDVNIPKNITAVQRKMPLNDVRNVQPSQRSNKEKSTSKPNDMLDEEAVKQLKEDFLIRFAGYRICPTFPYNLITNRSVSNKLDPMRPLCYYELHGICKDDSCTMQHESDYLMSDEEILCSVFAHCPTLCPAEKMFSEYAKELLNKKPSKPVGELVSELLSEIPESKRVIKACDMASRYDPEPSVEDCDEEIAYNIWPALTRSVLHNSVDASTSDIVDLN